MFYQERPKQSQYIIFHLANSKKRNLKKLLKWIDNSESFNTFEENKYLSNFEETDERKASIGASSFSDEDITENNESVSIDNVVKELNQVCEYWEREIGNKRFVEFKCGHNFHTKCASKSLKTQIRADKFPYYCWKPTCYKFVSDEYISQALGEWEELIRSRYIRYVSLNHNPSKNRFIYNKWNNTKNKWFWCRKCNNHFFYTEMKNCYTCGGKVIDINNAIKDWKGLDWNSTTLNATEQAAVNLYKDIHEYLAYRFKEDTF